MPSGSTRVFGRQHEHHEDQSGDRAAPRRRRQRCAAALSTVDIGVCAVMSLCRQEVAGKLIADQQEAARHHDGVGGKRVAEKPLRVRQ